MLHVDRENHTGASRPAQSLDLVDIIKHGDMKIGPELAERVFSECFYEPQADRLKTGGIAIARWAEFMRRDHWLDYSQITFCLLPDGRLVLVNGYHRLSGVIVFGRAVMFHVVVKPVSDEAEVARVFSSFDRPTATRIRKDPQLLNAIDFAARLGVPKMIATAVYRAIPSMENGMRYVTPADREHMLKFDILETRADAAAAWADEAQLFEVAMHNASGPMKKKLICVGPISVALVTLRYQPKKAVEFWSRVSANDGLTKNTPEHTFVEMIMTTKFDSWGKDNFAIPAAAWNAFYEGRALSYLRPSKILKINGTPIGKGT